MHLIEGTKEEIESTFTSPSKHFLRCTRRFEESESAVAEVFRISVGIAEIVMIRT